MNKNTELRQEVIRILDANITHIQQSISTKRSTLTNITDALVELINNNPANYSGDEAYQIVDRARIKLNMDIRLYEAALQATKTARNELVQLEGPIERFVASQRKRNKNVILDAILNVIDKFLELYQNFSGYKERVESTPRTQVNLDELVDGDTPSTADEGKREERLLSAQTAVAERQKKLQKRAKKERKDRKKMKEYESSSKTTGHVTLQKIKLDPPQNSHTHCNPPRKASIRKPPEFITLRKQKLSGENFFQKLLIKDEMPKYRYHSNNTNLETYIL
jgi:hypothetical protein